QAESGGSGGISDTQYLLMFDMDFKLKGMKWVGNVCQKLEIMFEEVEEKLCQDAKFVESQVETVGVNVNKFFAGIVHDFLPPSCTPPAHEIDSVHL
ncbi:hypothetical protein IFM89_022776, partial [Coptis chinensis]